MREAFTIIESLQDSREMGHDWTIFHQEEVKTDRKIPVPAAVHNAVGLDHEVHDHCIYWNYERIANYLVLSQYPLRESNYQDVKRTKVFRADYGSDTTGYIRVPGSLSDTVKSRYLEGTRVNYMAYDRMLEQDNPTVFLLSNAQFQQLLPSGMQSSIAEESEADAGSLEESLTNLPAFLPSP